MNERHLNTLLKMGVYLNQYKNICVSVSGGSDSDILIDLVEHARNKDSGNIYYIFVNTGLEFQATKDHIKFLEEKYNIHIETLRGEPIPLVVKKYGIPIASKIKSKHIDCYCRDLKSGINAYNHTGCFKGSTFAFSKNVKKLADFCKDNNIKISNKCCDLSKKKPLTKFEKSVDCDLAITGERSAEGGVRKFAHKSCFEEYNKNIKRAKFMPLWFWSDQDKTDYNTEFNIINSDCYTKYGMVRTGCVGCPYSLTLFSDLEIIRKYEPKLYKACQNVFGQSYELSRVFGIRKEKKEDQ